MDSKISETLRERLRGQNLSQLARDLGIKKSLISDWTAARRVPSLKNIEAVAKLADYLGLSLEELLLGKESGRKVISSVNFEEEKRSYRISIERIK